MAIVPKDKAKVQAARESTSTHFPNETTQAPEDSGQSALNHQVPETLIDPEDDEGGSTHFNNEEKYSAKSNRMNGGKTTAATETKVQPHKATAPATPKKMKPVPLAPESAKKHPAKAGILEDGGMGTDPDAVKGPGPDAEFPAGGPDSGIQASSRVLADDLEGDDGPEVGQQDTQHMPNDVDPAAGYLTVGTDMPGQEHQGDTGGDGLSDVDLEGANPQSGLEVEGAEEEPVEEEIEPVPVDEFDDLAGEEPVDPLAAEDSEVMEEPAMAPGGDDMAILDVDGADDDPDDCVFANNGMSVLVLKANRVIATMSKKVAVKAGHADFYLGEQFQEVTAVEMSKHGVRAGLRKMGFVLATVNVGKAEILNQRVAAKAKKLTAGVRAEHNARAEVLEQCLAIAAVGINRQYFKDTRNELRAALIEELETAGVRGADRLVRRVFASKGVEYAKAILTLATKLTNKSDEVRAEYVEALDLTSDGEVEDDKDLFGDQASPDFQSENIGAADDGMDDLEGDDDGFADGLDDAQAPQTVAAALSRPARRLNEVSARATGYSVTAADILSGKTPFPSY